MRTMLSVDNRGFTLMEVIVVMILMAIFAMLAVSRQPHTDMTLRAGAEVLKSHLRYAQMRAMSSDNSWGVSYDSDNGDYWLFRNEATQRVTLPGETQNSVNLMAKGISLSGALPLVFDAWGRPNLEADATFILDKTGKTETITIRRNTGFIQ